MAYFMETPLGRQVPVGDWGSYARDHILGLLYEFQRVPFNDGTLLFSLASIVNATHLDLAPAAIHARELVAMGLAEEPAPANFRITERGIAFVVAIQSNPFAGTL